MWNKESLHTLIGERLGDYQFIVVANREPYVHRFEGGKIVCIKPASGMASALDPVMRASGGVWVGASSGDADRQTADEHGHVAVPPDDPSYVLRRIWLSREEEDGFYYGLSNEGLWPLCHVAFVRPVFDPDDWETYRAVNTRFAEAVLEEAGSRPTFVFIQDYHFALLPRILKDANPNLIIAQFWHIPWPNREFIRTFPWKEELLDGMLGNDLLGFHLRYHCQNFLDAVESLMEAKVDPERSEVTRGGKVTVVRPFPIGIDFDGHVALADSPAVDTAIDAWRSRLGLTDDTFVGVGIDRLDYTKGIPERLRGLSRFFEKHPEFVERVRFVQIGVPSRSEIASYEQLASEVDDAVQEINNHWGTKTWQPITYLPRHFGSVDMMALHRLAHFCIVSSLHDGLNLVAKEYVASRTDEDGVLILSQFTGAALELTEALLINPFAQDEIAEAIHRALTLPEAERRKRMQKLRQTVAENNVYRWAGKILHALLKFEFPEEVEAASVGAR
jgi:alpha,alpha-trehalose-phosphate synthase [UDP-forming]